MAFFNPEIPIRVGITGMDGSGKSSAYRTFIGNVPPELTIVRISRFSSVIRKGREEIVGRNISQVLDNFHAWADSTKNRPIISLANILCVLYAWKIQEKRLTRQFSPDMVLALRDPYIDPIAYARFYSPGMLGAFSIEERDKILQKLHGAPINHRIIFLDVDPRVAVERIKQRMLEEAQTKNQLERAKWVHLHENESDLSKIRTEYDAALSYFQAKHGVDIVRIDTVKHSKVAVAEILFSTLMQPFY